MKRKKRCDQFPEFWFIFQNEMLILKILEIKEKLEYFHPIHAIQQ